MIEDRHYNKCKHVIHLKMDDMYLFEINFSSNAICLNGKKLGDYYDDQNNKDVFPYLAFNFYDSRVFKRKG